MNIFQPIASFWRKTTQDIQSDYKEDMKNQKSETSHQISHVKMADYSLMGKNKNQLYRVLKKCKFFAHQYNFYPIDFEWLPFFGYLDILTREASIKLQQLPELTWKNISNSIINGMVSPSSVRLKDDSEEEEIKVNFKDGGCSCMHVYKPKNLLHRLDRNTPVICFFPSLTENQDGFISFRKNCTDVRQWYVVVMNRRGLCEFLTTPPFWIAGNDQDTHEMFKKLHERAFMKNRPVLAIGWSMGAAHLTRYMGKYTDRSLDHIIACGNISGPFHSRDVRLSNEDLWKNNLSHFIKVAYLNRPLDEKGKTYIDLFENYKLNDYTEKYLLNAQQKEEHMKQMQNYKNIYEKMQACENIYELMFLHYHLMSDFNNNDIANHVKTQIQNYSIEEKEKVLSKNLNDLIRSNSELVFSYFKEQHAANYASQLNVPYVAICSDDDFLVKWQPKSVGQMLDSPFVTLIKSKSGGHCLFTDNPSDFSGEKNWAFNVILSHFEDIIKEKYSSKTGV